MIDRTRGFCPECKRGPFLLKKDGTLRHHGGDKKAVWPHHRYRCPGAGRKPFALYGE